MKARIGTEKEGPRRVNTGSDMVRRPVMLKHDPACGRTRPAQISGATGQAPRGGQLGALVARWGSQNRTTVTFK